MKYNHKHEWRISKEKTHALKSFFMMIQPIKTFNKKIHIYGMKHLYEKWARVVLQIPEDVDLYVYSDEFIHHAQENGFIFKHIKTSPFGDPIGFLNVSNKDIDRLIKAYRRNKNKR